jgi:sulfate adenylyltransferase subunit 1 (EFTu-like GTPase family)
MVNFLPAGYEKAVQSLWEGKATVTVLDGVLDPTSGRTRQAERVTVQDAPCRISHTTVKSTEPESQAAKVAQAVALYISPDVDIPTGSKITVTQNGVTKDYARSGEPAVFSSHQEVSLELFERWA